MVCHLATIHRAGGVCGSKDSKLHGMPYGWSNIQGIPTPANCSNGDPAGVTEQQPLAPAFADSKLYGLPADDLFHPLLSL